MPSSQTSIVVSDVDRMAVETCSGSELSVEILADAIATLAARLHAGTYELLVLLRQFDARHGWNNGFLSCAHWLHWRTGIDLGAAREKVRVAHALAVLPRISGAMARGELSYAKVRALTRIATPATETQLLDLARAGTAAHVERLVRAWRRVDRIEAARETERRHQRRELVTFVDDDGMVVVRGRLTPEAGAVLERALEAAADRLVRESAQASDDGQVAGEVTPGQRRADALACVAECALGAGLDRGTTGDRYQVVLHVDAPAPQEEAGASAEAAGQAAIELGTGATYVSAETSRRLACDASVVVMRHGADGSTLDVGRKTRTIPAAIRRALAARDQYCRFPGCTARRCDVHHVTHWVHGGVTSLSNTLLLCRRHHRAVHEGGFRVAWADSGEPVFVRPDGVRLDPAPPLQVPTTPRSHPVETSLTRGFSPSAPCWDGTPFDVVWAIDVLRRPGAAPGVPSSR
jgi:hypothetical protein